MALYILQEFSHITFLSYVAMNLSPSTLFTFTVASYLVTLRNSAQLMDLKYYFRPHNQILTYKFSITANTK